MRELINANETPKNSCSAELINSNGSKCLHFSDLITSLMQSFAKFNIANLEQFRINSTLLYSRLNLFPEGTLTKTMSHLQRLLKLQTNISFVNPQ